MINTELSYSRVSDRDYFNDFGNSQSTVSQSSVKREIRLFGETYSDKNIYNYDENEIIKNIDIKKCKLSKFLKAYSKKIYTDLDVFFSFLVC